VLRKFNLKHVIEERIERIMKGTGRQRRRFKYLLDDLKKIKYIENCWEELDHAPMEKLLWK
jgi:hypothetical protein